MQSLTEGSKRPFELTKDRNRVRPFLGTKKNRIDVQKYVGVYSLDNTNRTLQYKLTFPVMTRHRSASLLRQAIPFIEDPVMYSRATVANRRV